MNQQSGLAELVRMLLLVAAVVAVVILVFFAIGYGLGRLLL
jgi:preprotein translocase subunit SecE